MDSPGGYQLIGRTLPIWNSFGRIAPFSPAAPWLLRYFDQVQSRLHSRAMHPSPRSSLVNQILLPGAILPLFLSHASFPWQLPGQSVLTRYNPASIPEQCILPHTAPWLLRCCDQV